MHAHLARIPILRSHQFRGSVGSQRMDLRLSSSARQETTPAHLSIGVSLSSLSISDKEIDEDGCISKQWDVPQSLPGCRWLRISTPPSLIRNLPPSGALLQSRQACFLIVNIMASCMRLFPEHNACATHQACHNTAEYSLLGAGTLLLYEASPHNVQRLNVPLRRLRAECKASATSCSQLKVQHNCVTHVHREKLGSSKLACTGRCFACNCIGFHMHARFCAGSGCVFVHKCTPISFWTCNLFERL